MRPINRGAWPTKANGNKYVFNNWRRAKPYLVDRTGLYCHFCEMRVNNSLAVEHIKSRTDHPKLSNYWNNFLLICTSCNSSKNAKQVLSPYNQKYYWPHLNNTLLAFYSPLCGPDALIVIPKPGLTANQKARAESTIALYELDKRSTSNGDSDNRFKERMEATKQAIDRRTEYQNGKATIEAIVDSATTKGFFSVWFDVFSDITPVKQALLQAPEFKIDIATWFNAALDPSPRNPNLSDPI